MLYYPFVIGCVAVNDFCQKCLSLTNIAANFVVASATVTAVAPIIFSPK